MSGRCYVACLRPSSSLPFTRAGPARGLPHEDGRRAPKALLARRASGPFYGFRILKACDSLVNECDRGPQFTSPLRLRSGRGLTFSLAPREKGLSLFTGSGEDSTQEVEALAVVRGSHTYRRQANLMPRQTSCQQGRQRQSQRLRAAIHSYLSATTRAAPSVDARRPSAALRPSTFVA